MSKVLNMSHRFLIGLLAMALLLTWSTDGLAFKLFSADMEKPNPQFTRNDGQISAKLIPRAKSGSVIINFKVIDGGTLEEVKGVDFDTVDRPEVDEKNFKSEVFEIDIAQVKPGGTATVAVTSDFFTQSTKYYVYNPKRGDPWLPDVQAENRSLPQSVQELVIKVKDGGDLDADGRADGRISLIGGPRDSFWGYALGTLFIRFFGIFIVLTVLMIGMLISGFIFKKLLRTESTGVKAAEAPGAPTTSPAPAPAAVTEIPDRPAEVPDEVAAAIAVGLHQHLKRFRTREPVPAADASGNVWGRDGRQRIMSDRLQVFRRSGPKQE